MQTKINNWNLFYYPENINFKEITDNLEILFQTKIKDSLASY